MALLSGRERLQPSLLDRLTDDQPTAQKDRPDGGALTMAQLRQAVLRDLAALFNTTNLETLGDLENHPNVAASTLNYGIPGLTGLLDVGTRIRTLETELAEAIRRYEPRIRRDTVRVRVRGADETNGMRAMVLEVEGELWAQPMPLQLFVETRIDVETRNASVVESKPRAVNGP